MMSLQFLFLVVRDSSITFFISLLLIDSKIKRYDTFSYFYHNETILNLHYI